MARDPINTHYAQALLALATAENAVDRVQADLQRLRELLQANPQLLWFLKDPTIRPEGKRQALAELFGGRVHGLVLHMLLILADQERGNRLMAILDEFDAQAAAARAVVTGTVSSALPLDEATLERLAAELSRLTGKRVQLVAKVEPGLLGGVVIQVGERIIDASLRRKLEQIRTTLAQ